jgi:tetratricopeptide (TPR) repeat protein
MAARFEIHRETGAAGAPGEASSPSAEVFDRLVREGASIERFLELGLATGEPALRERAYRHALSIAPESALSHLCLASAFSEQGKGREGIAELRNAIELEPELDVAHYELGKGLIRTDDLAGAAAAFRRTVELLPEYAPAWSNLGAALGELGDLPGAVEALTQAVAHDRFSHVLHNNLGVTYRNLGRLEEAESEFELVLRLAPDFVFGQYNLAHTHYLQGRYPKAVATFEKAQGMDPSRSPRQSLLLAVTRLASGDTEGAERDYREVFGRLSGQPKKDMLTVAEWDLRQVARDRKGDATLKRALVLIRGLA